ncbi:MAG: NAD(P)-dependent alcohol dehydrogenase [Corynebacterium sp.]|nr:NAD(P)-dependent alcohol dehydrogenase [Corynebacterium sp.]
MSFTTTSYAAPAAGAPLEEYQLTRRDLGPDDVHIAIEFVGICHSDIHTVRGDWGPRSYPLVPGHEIIGRVKALGSEVKNFKIGDRVGVGCFVNSCGQCAACQAGEESYCATGPTPTYGGVDKYSLEKYAEGEVTQGGYAKDIVTKAHFVVPIPEHLDAASAAPLLCAGITTYSPLKHWGVSKDTRVGIIGMGGVGHVAVKIAAAMGAEVTVFGHSESKRDDALAFGAKAYVSTKDPKFLEEYKEHFDVILNTTSVNLDMNEYMNLLAFDGTMVIIGLPGEPLGAMARTFTQRRRSLAGSLVGGIPETIEMLNFCADHKVTPEIEIIPPSQINEAYDRTLASQVRYRFVIDMSKA